MLALVGNIPGDSNKKCMLRKIVLVVVWSISTETPSSFLARSFPLLRRARGARETGVLCEREIEIMNFMTRSIYPQDLKNRAGDQRLGMISGSPTLRVEQRTFSSERTSVSDRTRKSVIL